MNGYNPAGYRELAAAVVERAAQDYKHALRVLRRYPNDTDANKLKWDCEEFFLHEIGTYSDLDGGYIMRGIRENIEREGKRGQKKAKQT